MNVFVFSQPGSLIKNSVLNLHLCLSVLVIQHFVFAASKWKVSVKVVSTARRLCKKINAVYQKIWDFLFCKVALSETNLYVTSHFTLLIDFNIFLSLFLTIKSTKNITTSRTKPRLDFTRSST